MTAYFPASTYSKYPDRYPANAPQYAEWAEGAYVDCSDGKQYIDMVSALGAIILGHQHPDVEQAVIRQLCRGTSFSLPTRLEGELAERLCGLVPGAEMVRFQKNGYDVTTAATRIARAASGRPRVLMLSNGYHGQSDVFMGRAPKNGGVPRTSQSLTVYCEPNDLESLEHALRTHKPACFITEAVVTGDPVEPPADYFRQVRDLCTKHGTLLILDEMVTGFRCGFPGAVTEYDIDADLLCYGKALANGHALSALCGPRALMKRIDEDVFMSTTFGGEATALAASLATLDVLDKRNVATKLFAFGSAMMQVFNELAMEHGVNARVYGYPARPMMRFNDPQQKQQYLEALTDCGVLCQGYFNLTLAHVGVVKPFVTALDTAFSKVADRYAKAS